MLQNIDFYYFSPTGGTKKEGEALAAVLAESVHAIDLAAKTLSAPASDVVVVAVPVFGGRIPALVSERIRQLGGTGKKAVTAVVYGVRAYEDALLELNDVMTECGFEVIASALWSHSIRSSPRSVQEDRMQWILRKSSSLQSVFWMQWKTAVPVQ